MIKVQRPFILVTIGLLILFFLYGNFKTASDKRTPGGSGSDFSDLGGKLSSGAGQAVSPTPSPSSSPINSEIISKRDKAAQELDSKIADTQAKIAQYKTSDQQYLNQSVSLANQINNELSLDIKSGGNRPSMAKSLQTQADYVKFLMDLNDKQLIAAEYEESELEALKSGDFALANQLIQDQEVNNLTDKEGEISDKLTQILNKLDQLPTQTPQ